jgi:hypothetical protein
MVNLASVGWVGASLQPTIPYYKKVGFVPLPTLRLLEKMSGAAKLTRPT